MVIGTSLAGMSPPPNASLPCLISHLHVYLKLWSGIRDLNFDLVAYTWVVMYNISTAVYLICISHIKRSHPDISNFDFMFALSMTSLPHFFLSAAPCSALYHCGCITYCCYLPPVRCCSVFQSLTRVSFTCHFCAFLLLPGMVLLLSILLFLFFFLFSAREYYLIRSPGSITQ